MTETFNTILHNASLGMLILAPVLIAIPPRKLDLYTFALSGAFVASANRLVKERTGQGLLSQLPGAQAARAEQQTAKGRVLEEIVGGDRIQGSLERRDRLTGAEDWKQKRLAEEREKLEAGEGYGGMIMDQIWNVWNWGDHKAENLKWKDEEVVRERLSEREMEKRKKRTEAEFANFGSGFVADWEEARRGER